MSEAIRAMWMRGGTSKGGFFLAEDLPADPAARDAFLLRAFGSPDPRQIDGMGGADPLTSKVAVVSRSAHDGADVDYLFLQVFVDQAIVTDAQNCGNMLAGVGPFAIERGLVEAQEGETRSRSSWSTPASSPPRPSARPAAPSPMKATPASTACPAPPRRCRSPLPTSPAPAAARCSPPATPWT